jgi:monofunctional biosynthetic peptidoglycan transglycosylase
MPHISQKYISLKNRLLNIITSPMRLFRSICFSIGLAVMMAAALTVTAAVGFYHSLPAIDKMSFEQFKELGAQKLATRLSDSKKKQIWVGIDQISRDYLYTIVMGEDSEFFDHDGLNYDAIVEAALENIKKKKYEYGASTISQQVVKNLFLTNEKSIVRKLKEIVVTLKMEGHFTKNQILEVYLNTAEFGPDIYGVHAAARHYFKKEPSKITVPEGALIAVMLPSPRRYHYAIVENQNLTSKNRRKIHRIIADMWANEFISFQQYQKYIRYDYFKSPTRVPAKSR